MTSNGPTWPDPPPGQGPGQAPPGQYQPGSYQHPPTQAVPNYAPPSTADYQSHDPFASPVNPGVDGPQGGGGGQRALLAGVLGGLLTLGIITAVFLLISSDDGESADPEPTNSSLPDEEDDPGVTQPTTDDRIGSEVTGLELLAGDCINYDTASATIETFSVVTCGTPHLAEIAAQVEHPDAGGGFPGVDELHTWAATPCREASTDYLGTDVLATTFDSTTLVPDFDEWGQGLYQVSCLIQAADGSRLIESVEGRGSSYPRATDVPINRLRPGDCFLPNAEQTAFELGVDDITVLTACNEDHDGLFFGRAVLPGGTTAPFPGQDTVDADGVDLCNDAFTRYFGVTHEGFNYRFWTPSQAQWDDGERTVHCAVLDEKGLPPRLDFASFQPMAALPIGQCFVFGPEETVDLMRLDDQVEPVDCAQPHNGELFGFGELPTSTDPFPGTDVLDNQIQQDCIALFTEYVGISPFDSTSGDFIYWFPNETGWETNDLRWACALLTDETSVGSIENTNA